MSSSCSAPCSSCLQLLSSCLPWSHPSCVCFRVSSIVVVYVVQVVLTFPVVCFSLSLGFQKGLNNVTNVTASSISNSELFTSVWDESSRGRWRRCVKVKSQLETFSRACFIYDCSDFFLLRIIACRNWGSFRNAFTCDLILVLFYFFDIAILTFDLLKLVFSEEKEEAMSF